MIHTILTLLITEVLGDCDASESDTSTGPRGLVHLAEDQRHLGFAVKLDDACFLHFVVQVVTLTSPLADASEHRITAMGLCNVVLKW
jgi:hypothetical protein